jgi:osmotically inducible protein OsmC
MTDRTASVVWAGTLFEGSGSVSFDSSGLVTDAPVSWPARAEEPGGKTSPEELIAAAHASCYSMALSKALADKGTPAEKLETSATVTFVPGTGITKSAITVRVTAPGLDEAGLTETTQGAKDGCPVSTALADSVEITLDAALA